MCNKCGNLALKHDLSIYTNKRPHLHLVHNADPTKSKTLRKKYSADCYKRFRKLKGAVNKLIIKHDALELTSKVLGNIKDVDNNEVGIKNFLDFKDDVEKVQQFMDWLEKAEDLGILEVFEREGRSVVSRNEWQNKYIKAGYIKGIKHADAAMRKLGLEVPDDEDMGLTLAKPIHADKLGLLYVRNFRQLSGITAEMDKQISVILAESIANGLGPYEVARKINDRIDKIGITRARTLARTEIIRAHAEATLNRFEEYGIKEIVAKTEFSTAGDNKVCEICASLEGRTFTIAEARGLIPRHPNCRCCWLPFI